MVIYIDDHCFLKTQYLYMNKIILNDRTFIIKAVVNSDDVSDELREKLKRKYSVNIVLKDDKNNYVFVDEIVDANIINTSEVNNEI